MRVRIVIAALLAIASALVPPQFADAKPNDRPDSGGCSGGADGPAIQVGCETAAPRPPERPARPSGITNPPRPCTSVPATAIDGWDPDAYDDTTVTASGFVLFRTPEGTIGRRYPDGREQRAFIRTCPDQPAANGAYWIDVGITVDDVIDDADNRVRRQIPAPDLDMSPAPDVGGLVNLGLWLAITPPEPVTVRAEAGALWAEVTATLATTTWDMGNGDIVTCDGPGVPIVDGDDPGEGPCGYTYRQSTPDDQPHEISVTARWTITYRSSAGAGTRPPLERSLTVDYDIDEIQTVGVSN